jgi:F420-dependent oxidoreductase-like protein
MRFAFWPAPQQPWSEVVELARHVETTGWDRLYFADHFMPNGEDTSGEWTEAWTTLAALAATVPRIQLATLVTGNTYRHPAVLAKMAANIDHISGGRLVLGLGSGWQENEHTAYGISFYSVRERLARLDEACAVIKSLFENEKTNFEGRYYQLKDAPLEPKPVQAHVPLLIGGGGEKVTLRIVAKHADEWNVWGTPETMRQKGEILARHCADVGRDPADIQHSAVALLFLSDDEAFIEKIKQNVTGQPIIAGNVAEVRETVLAYQAAGVDELIVPDFTLGRGSRKLATLDQFIKEVASVAR